VLIDITAEHVEALAGVYLSPHYDKPVATPDFHRECWTRYCTDHPACATAAPRGFAKSTALTHDFVLANVLLRAEEYVIIVSASEEMAVEHLSDIAAELRDNEELVSDFEVKGFIQEQKTDIVVECKDGHQFRILARGAEQTIRGRKWHGKRPGLIVCDDLEDDEQVESRDRRKKFSRWFFRACKQALRRGGRIRVHGTILHVDSLLMHLMKNRQWDSKLYKAHSALQDFSNLLWPEAFSEAELRRKRQEFLDEGDSAGYAQEYLNDPQDYEDRYLRREQFRPMDDEDRDVFKRFYVGVDLAISKRDAGNRTCFVIGGKSADNLSHVVDVRLGRFDAQEIVDEFFYIDECWGPDAFYIENGHIWQAIEPTLNKEMQHRDRWLTIVTLQPVKDKKLRGRSFQRRMKAGGVRFMTDASWFDEYRDELLLFTGNSEAILDDQFDATATLFVGMDKAVDTVGEDEWVAEQEDLDDLIALRSRLVGGGRNAVTGY
jgi:predicted phage terminase large subunit-like protein